MVPIRARMTLVLLDLESGRTLLDLIEKGLQNEVKKPIFLGTHVDLMQNSSTKPHQRW